MNGRRIIFIGDDIAGTQYDVAHVKWGSFWKLPKIDQYKELIDYCTTTDATQNGKRGLIFTGPNGATIFLPAAGGRIGYEMGDSGVNCWSSTANRGAGSDKAYYYSDLQGWNGYTFRRTGYPVRPVYSIDLSISQNHVIITIGNSTTIDITEGNGNYEISCSNSEIVKAKINGSTITLTAQGLGSAVVTIKDTFTNQTVDIAVSVRSAVSYVPAEAIDLGLPSGTLWASWNLGATKPEEYGGYYSWGETEVKDVYDWSNYTHCEGTSESCSNIGDNIAGTEYDVAHMKWGGSWLMPSRTQIDELIKYCSHEWTSENGVIGDKFISKKNGNSIFLPAAGFYWDEDLVSLSEYSYYWSDSQSPDRETHAYGLKSNDDNTSTSRSKRMYGFPVRPVWPAEPVQDLSISQNSVALTVGSNTSVEIISGSGNYELSNSNSSVLEATLDGTTIWFSAINAGIAVVTVKDNSTRQTATINVFVSLFEDFPIAEAIDLGLPSGTKWASWNVGAFYPEQFGGYYSWGETEKKDYYYWTTYSFSDGTGTIIPHIVDDIAGTKYDIAHAKWGEYWHIPRVEQIKELLDNCTYEWTTRNGVNGTLFTGPNGATIFLPASGMREYDDLFFRNTTGRYWSSEGDSDFYSGFLNFYSGLWNQWRLWRYLGFSVRAVYSDEPLNSLKLSQNSIVLATGKKVTIEIVSGSGNYEISNSNESVVKSSLVDTAISLTPLSDGNSIVSVKDISSGQSAIIEVSVLYPSGECPVAEAVDLGLPSGTRWASWNVGASKPEEFGGYYAWGETEEKDYYDWSNYTHCDGSSTTCHRFNDDIADSEYDVAHVKWGGSWTLPTQMQIRELVRYCSREWSSQNGVNGILFTGPNGATVFFPAAGFCWLGSLYAGSMEGNYYWSSIPENSNAWGGAYGLFFDSNDCHGFNRYGRDYGFPVRPVCPPALIPDLSISQDSVELNVGNTAFIEITSGSGNYEITNTNTSVVDATLDGTLIKLKGLSEGSAVVTVKDVSSNQTADIFVSVGPEIPSTRSISRPFYIYRNDGGFNAFYHDDIDSIMYSNFDADSIYHADIVSQIIYTADSIYIIPVEAIDSISFITPETVYKPGVRVIDDLAEYVISSDSVSFVIAYATPQNLLPKVGEKIVTTSLSDGFPEGFVGKVMTIENVADGIKVNCEGAGLTDIYEVFFGCTHNEEYNDPVGKRNAKSQFEPGVLIIRPGKNYRDLRETLTVEYDYLDDIAFGFTPDLAFNIEPVWTIKAFVIVSPLVGVYASAICTGDFYVEERVGLTGSLKWEKDFPIPVISRDHIPVYPPYLYFYENIGAFIRADFESAFKCNWNQHYRQVITLEYSNIGDQILKKPSKIPFLVNSSHGEEGLLNGTLAAGVYAECGFTLIDKAIDRVGVRGEYGWEASAQAVIHKRDFEEACRSTALYEQMRNCGFTVNNFWNFSILAAAGPWGVDWTPLHNKKELWRMSYVPEFSNLEASSKGGKAICNMTASGKILNPLGVGFAIVDKNDNQEFASFADYKGETTDYQCEFSNLPKNKKYTVYPTVKAWDYTMLATPTCELKVTGMPVSITDFKQTGSHYEKDGYTYNGWTYSYEYDVTVTVELDDTEGVADWGYVYEDPNGKIARISLKDFSSPYSDSRYVYYRNEASSTVRLYEFVKYEGSENYEYGEPVDYEVHHGLTTCPDGNHPHMIDMGLPSGTKWACCNVGASSPEQYGGYYAWGETEEKSVYNDVTYKYSSGVDEDGDGWYDDYHEDTDSFGIWQHIGDDIAGTQYDVAHVKWGGSWRMPSYEQQWELLENCSWTWTTQNGVNGMLVTGPNGGTVFLPAAGYRWYDNLDEEGLYGYYWSSSLSPDSEYGAYYLFLGFTNKYWYNRGLGLSVRAVCP